MNGASVHCARIMPCVVSTELMLVAPAAFAAAIALRSAGPNSTSFGILTELTATASDAMTRRGFDDGLTGTPSISELIVNTVCGSATTFAKNDAGVLPGTRTPIWPGQLQ